MEAWKEVFARFHIVADAGRKLVDDKTASIAPEMYSHMQYDGSLIEHGTRINWNGALKRATVNLWDAKENNPENAPILWENIAYKLGNRIVPETITAGSAFAKDELGWWNDKLYISLIDNNVWTPEQYSEGWLVKDMEVNE